MVRISVDQHKVEEPSLVRCLELGGRPAVMMKSWRLEHRELLT